jgi:serine/alanine adding enzyme
MTAGNLQVLSLAAAAGDASFAAAWDGLAAAYGDAYYRRDYLAAVEPTEPGQIMLALYRDDGGAVLYPVGRRPLEALPLPSALTRDRFDLLTHHEYGGPLVISDDDKSALRCAFDHAFIQWCGDIGVVAEFVRFHPVLATQRGWESAYATRLSCTNIMLDLALDDAALLADMRGTTRRAIQSGERRGLRITTLTPETAPRFSGLYQKNMDRLAARAEYYFGDDHFVRLAKLAGTATLLAAEDAGGALAGAASFLAASGIAHYHLSAADRAMSRLSPLNALIFHAAGQLRSQGIRWLHLGGAAKSQPGLRAFKEGFSSLRRDYAIGTRVHDAARYNALRDAAAVAEGRFFPAYRAMRLAA